MRLSLMVRRSQSHRPAGVILSLHPSDRGCWMNKRGNPKSLVASQPGNLNAVKQGVHSPRLIRARAAEIASELTESFEFSPAERLAVHEAARCIAILEATAISISVDSSTGRGSPGISSPTVPELRASSRTGWTGCRRQSSDRPRPRRLPRAAISPTTYGLAAHRSRTRCDGDRT
jgi:hypothetical protein